MLSELSIRDLALIERAELAFGPGLNVVSGETGAGKTMLVGSLELLLGHAPRGGGAAWVRKGASEARVEARFVLGHAALVARVEDFLRAELPELAEAWAAEREGAPELILGRTLAPDGRTRAHVNQRPVTLKALRGLAPLLLEIHGQNEHQRLFEAEEELVLLDAYGGLGRRAAAYRAERAAWLQARARAERLEGARLERRQRLEVLLFQADELGRAELERGEHARLSEEREVLRSAAQLGHELGALARALGEDDDATVDAVRHAVRVVERWSALVPKLSAPLEELRSAQVHLEEAHAALSSFVGGLDDDPARLEAVEERLAELERLERKYGCDEGGLFERAEEIGGELARLSSEEEETGAARAEIRAAEAALARRGDALAGERRALAPRLVAEVARALQDLGLARARFEIAFAPRKSDERFGPFGVEDLGFVLSANPGEDLRPLRDVASGGETARIMLALRTVLSAGEPDRTLVFDEIDSGVGGRLGPVVGAHLRRLARAQQVFCVTHLPAIAALADRHLRAHKEARRGRTSVVLEPLEGEARVTEVADMIAGGAAEETARAEARRLLKSAR